MRESFCGMLKKRPKIPCLQGHFGENYGSNLIKLWVLPLFTAVKEDKLLNEWWGMKWNSVVRISINVTHPISILFTPPHLSIAYSHITHQLKPNAIVYSVYKKILRMLCCHVTSVFHKKTVCDFPVVLTGRVSCTPRLTHNTNARMHKHTHTYTHTHSHQRTQQALGAMPWPLVPSQRGAVHQNTTEPLIPLCSSCKFCSFSPGAQRSPVLFCEKERGGGGVERDAREQRSEATVTLCVCVCVR